MSRTSRNLIESGSCRSSENDLIHSWSRPIPCPRDRLAIHAVAEFLMLKSRTAREWGGVDGDEMVHMMEVR